MLLNKKNKTSSQKTKQRIYRNKSANSETRQQFAHRVILSLIVTVAIFWILFAPSFGVIDLVQKQHQRRQLEKAIVQLTNENQQLEANITHLENDPQFLEEEARQRGYLRKNERIYDFSHKK